MVLYLQNFFQILSLAFLLKIFLNFATFSLNILIGEKSVLIQILYL